MSRGIIYCVWGDKATWETELLFSIKQSQLLNLPICVLSDRAIKIGDIETIVVSEKDKQKAKNGHKTGYALKTFLFNYSPFETNLFLDTDAFVINSNLEYGFTQCENHGIALSLAPLYDLKEFASEKTTKIVEEIVGLPIGDCCACHYNTGVFFFQKQPKTASFFEKWHELATNYTLSPETLFTVTCCILKFNPAVLPFTWNFRAHVPIVKQYGDIKIWHSREADFESFLHSRSTKIGNVLFM